MTSLFELFLRHIRDRFRRSKKDVEADSTCIQGLVDGHQIQKSDDRRWWTHWLLRHESKVLPVFLNVELRDGMVIDQDIA